MNSAFLRAVGAGFLVGVTGAGTPIACLHVMTNPGAPVSDAAILGFVCALFYGGWLGASVAVVGTVNRLRSHRGARDPSPLSRLRMTRAPSRSRQESGEGGLAGGIALFVWLFGCGYFLHGLTYDQLPASLPATRWMMAGFVVAITGGVLVGALLLGRVLARGLGVLNAKRFAMPVALTVFVVSAALPAALAWPRAPRTVASASNTEPPYPEATSRATPPPASSLPLAQQQPVSHLALVGLDGADWRVLQPLIDQGQLPHFARLVAEGVSGPLETIPDSNSAVIWASIYSGKRAGEHRIHDFFRVTFPGMRVGFFPIHRVFLKEFADVAAKVGLARFRTVSRYDLEVLPLWEITDHLGVSTGLVDGYLYSFPVPTPVTPDSYAVGYGASEWTAQLSRPERAARAADVGLFVQPPELFRDLRTALGGADFDWQAAVGGQLLQARPLPRFFSFYTHEPDTVQHLFWKWFEPDKYFGVRAADRDERRDRIAERYRAFDRWLGELRDRLGPDAAILVASDHGHSPTILHQKFFTQHRHGPPGILIASGGPLRRGMRVDDASIYDVAPTVLWLLGLPVPEDLAGHARTDFLSPERTPEFPLRSTPTFEGLWPSTIRSGATKGFEDEELEKLRALGYL